MHAHLDRINSTAVLFNFGWRPASVQVLNTRITSFFSIRCSLSGSDVYKGFKIIFWGRAAPPGMELLWLITQGLRRGTHGASLSVPLGQAGRPSPSFSCWLAELSSNPCWASSQLWSGACPICFSRCPFLPKIRRESQIIMNNTSGPNGLLLFRQLHAHVINEFLIRTETKLTESMVN